MEYLDIYDEQGNKLGIKKSRKEAHDKGFWHKAVHIWIVNPKGEILIQKRSALKDNHPNMWDISAAGHVSAGDDDINSAQREVEEELGIKISPQELIQIGLAKTSKERPGYINREFNHIYLINKDFKLSDVRKQDEEVSEVKFIPYKELKKIIAARDISFVPHPEEYKLLFEYLEKMN